MCCLDCSLFCSLLLSYILFTALAKAPKWPLFRYPVGKASSRQPPTGRAGSPKGNPTPPPAHLTPDQSSQTEHYEKTGQKEGSQYESESQDNNREAQRSDN